MLHHHFCYVSYYPMKVINTIFMHINIMLELHLGGAPVSRSALNFVSKNRDRNWSNKWQEILKVYR